MLNLRELFVSCFNVLVEAVICCTVVASTNRDVYLHIIQPGDGYACFKLSVHVTY